MMVKELLILIILHTCKVKCVQYKLFYILVDIYAEVINLFSYRPKPVPCMELYCAIGLSVH